MKTERASESVDLAYKLGAIVVKVGSLLVVLAWIYFQTSENARAIAKIEEKQDAISAIQTDIAVIKNELSNIRKTIDRK